MNDERPSGEQPTALDEDRAALRGLSGDLDYPAQLALVERRTGVRLDAAWLDQPVGLGNSVRLSELLFCASSTLIRPAPLRP
ncbi:hypothetical protein JNW88_27175 [Micromonospora sp. ATA32]|nr:hypothetical protein [Micromonospora sp. ATA32]